MEQRFFGLTTIQVRKLAFQIAEKMEFHITNKDEKHAGKDWLAGFLSRIPELSLRTSESTSLARASSFNTKMWKHSSIF
jgi:hypothetical protein